MIVTIGQHVRLKGDVRIIPKDEMIIESDTFVDINGTLFYKFKIGDDTKRYELLKYAALASFSSITGGVTVHADLTGLLANDHPQYALVASLAAVAFTGDYNDLLNLPPIPPPGPSTLADLTDVSIPFPADGEVLTYNAATGRWISSAAAGGITHPQVMARGVFAGPY